MSHDKALHKSTDTLLYYQAKVKVAMTIGGQHYLQSLHRQPAGNTCCVWWLPLLADILVVTLPALQHHCEIILTVRRVCMVATSQPHSNIFHVTTIHCMPNELSLYTKRSKVSVRSFVCP